MYVKIYLGAHLYEICHEYFFFKSRAVFPNRALEFIGTVLEDRSKKTYTKDGLISSCSKILGKTVNKSGPEFSIGRILEYFNPKRKK